MNPAKHWDAVYASKRDEEVSWTEADPRTSLALIAEVAPQRARVIDVGGGTSRLAGRLLDGGHDVAVLDVRRRRWNGRGRRWGSGRTAPGGSSPT